ncbi:MAG: peptidoglycan-associated lipoprotein Pal [Alphaproteobacteria bacterium]|nr:peptidoglycan-associated lipoprotein Pal [Alphaproteobacteria bacterium]
MVRKFVGLFAGLLLLAACETAPESTGAGAGTGAAAPAPARQTATGAPRPGSQEDLVANVGDRVFFDLDKSDLKPEARARAERWAGWLKQYANVSVTIEGHCDERGTREYNLALGERRATAIRNFLVAQGIPATRVATISYGKERPAVLGASEASWSQNRRGVMMVK